jgi:mevalonate kinase
MSTDSSRTKLVKALRSIFYKVKVIMPSKPSQPVSGALNDWLKDFKAQGRVQSASGKAILVGEHAVVYGASAIAIPLENLRIELNIANLTQPRSHSITINQKKVPAEVAEIVGEAIKLLGIKNAPFLSVVGHSNLPMGAGLGSSATLCIAIIKTLAEVFQCYLSTNELAQMANVLEGRFHGKPSGLDTAVIAHNQAIRFRKNSHVEHINLGSNSTPDRAQVEWHFALIDTHQRAATRDMIKKVAPYFQNFELDSLKDCFDAISDQVYQGLVNNEPAKVGAAMNQMHGHLLSAGAITSELAERIDYCHQIGCHGAKSTGAGGGGVVLALLEGERFQEQVRDLTEKYQPENIQTIQMT